MEKNDKDVQKTTEMSVQKKNCDEDRLWEANLLLTAFEVFHGKHKVLQGWTYTHKTAKRAHCFNNTTKNHS